MYQIGILEPILPIYFLLFANKLGNFIIFYEKIKTAKWCKPYQNIFEKKKNVLWDRLQIKSFSSGLETVFPLHSSFLQSAIRLAEPDLWSKIFWITKIWKFTTPRSVSTCRKRKKLATSLEKFWPIRNVWIWLIFLSNKRHWTR